MLTNDRNRTMKRERRRHTGNGATPEFGAAVRAFLEKHGIAQKDLAAASHRSSGALSQILRGNRAVQTQTKRSIIEAALTLMQERGIAPDSEDVQFAGIGGVLIGPSAASVSHQLTREQADRQIADAISFAEREIVFLGGVSERTSTRDWYELLAQQLLAKPDLRIFFYLEALQGLFWRSVSLDPTVPNNARAYDDIKRRYALQTQEMPRMVYQILNAQVSDPQHFAQCAKRFTVCEVDMPVYTVYAKIDDVFFRTPRNHLRASLSSTELLDDPSDLRWQQAVEYIQYFDRLRSERRLVSESNAEKLAVFSERGHHLRGLVSRRTFALDTSLETRVVHGLIFDRSGDLLLHYRDESAHDNRNMWDKSFGGNADYSVDMSLRDTARRELKEEVFTALTSKLREVAQEHHIPMDCPVPTIVDCGEWRGHAGVAPWNGPDEQRWPMFHLFECRPFPSRRYLGEHDNVVLRMLYADIFVFVCSAGFATLTQTISQLAPEYPTCRWVTISHSVDSTRFTSDLKDYFSQPALYRKLREVRNTILTAFPKKHEEQH